MNGRFAAGDTPRKGFKSPSRTKEARFTGVCCALAHVELGSHTTSADASRSGDSDPAREAAHPASGSAVAMADVLLTPRYGGSILVSQNRQNQLDVPAGAVYRGSA